MGFTSSCQMQAIVWVNGNKISLLNKVVINDPFWIWLIEKAKASNGCVLVHCLAGISRSATIAIAYIMKRMDMSLDEAYRWGQEHALWDWLLLWPESWEDMVGGGEGGGDHVKADHDYFSYTLYRWLDFSMVFQRLEKNAFL